MCDRQGGQREQDDGRPAEDASWRQLAAVHTVAAGEAVVAPRITRALLNRYAGTFTPTVNHDEVLGALTDRERQIVLLVAEGLSNI